MSDATPTSLPLPPTGAGWDDDLDFSIVGEDAARPRIIMPALPHDAVVTALGTTLTYRGARYTVAVDGEVVRRSRSGVTPVRDADLVALLRREALRARSVA